MGGPGFGKDEWSSIPLMKKGRRRGGGRGILVELFEEKKQRVRNACLKNP